MAAGQDSGFTAIFWIWMAAGVAFLILEVVTPAVFFICFTVGAAVAGIYSYFNPTDYYWQIGIFVLVSLVLIPFTRKFARRLSSGPTQGANVDRMIGGTAVVIRSIMPDEPGQVRFESEHWAASSTVPVNEGSRVKIIAIKGTRVDVEPI